MENQKQGLRNFAVNIEPTIRKIKESINYGKGKPAKLSLSEQHSIMQFYREVVDYISK